MKEKYSTRKREFLLVELEYHQTILRYKAEISKICDRLVEQKKTSI